MRWMASFRSLAAVSLLCFAFGCSSSSADADASRDRDSDSSPSPGSGIQYQGESPLTLAPGERARLSFRALPKGTHLVRFGMTGDSGDASLDADLTETSSDGRITVELTAPSSSRTFTVRASLDSGSSAEVPVSVSGIGFGNIEVVPSYTGERTVRRWTATVATGTSCAELVGIPPPDGPLVDEVSPPRHPMVKAAPVGPPLVVTVRAGHFAGGCMDVRGLRVGETKQVTISLLDRPLDLSFGELSVDLLLDPDGGSLRYLLDSSCEASARASVPGADAPSLLDAISEALPSQALSAFDEQRATLGWDEQTSLHLEAKEISLRTLFRDRLASGIEGLRLASGLRAWLSPGASSGKARFEVDSLFGVPARAAGFEEEVSMSFAAAPGDRVQLGGELDFSIRALLAEAALEPTLEEAPGAASIEEALAMLVGCDSLVETLLEGAPPLAGCPESCFETACEKALASMWRRGLEGEAPTRLTITASADAKVGNEAELTGFDGSWVGSFTQGELSLPARGRAVGEVEGSK